jgi:hypothetical protein
MPFGVRWILCADHAPQFKNQYLQWYKSTVTQFGIIPCRQKRIIEFCLLVVSWTHVCMRSHEIQKVIDAVEAAHGSVALYGSDRSEEHGTCFTITGVPATFSVHTQEGTLAPGHYNIQIEGRPPGDYVYISVVSLDAFLELVDRVRGPEAQWPRLDEEAS